MVPQEPLPKSTQDISEVFMVNADNRNESEQCIAAEEQKWTSNFLHSTQSQTEPQAVPKEIRGLRGKYEF